ncbi:MAG: hypothetical protein HQ527_02220 [Cyanobacteria bacterium]|nr:hypothetical protein [Cyanobacteria bacterium bin.51]
MATGMATAAALVNERLCGEFQQAITALSWSADGEFLAIASAGGELLLWELGGSGVSDMAFAPMALEAGWLDAAVWQPDGQLLAAAAGREVRLWDGAERQWHPYRLDLPGSVQALAFAPGSSLLATASADGSVGLWDGRGRLQQSLDGEGQGFQTLAWRPDGRYLAAGGEQGRWWLWPVALPARQRQRRSGGAGFA